MEKKLLTSNSNELTEKNIVEEPTAHKPTLEEITQFLQKVNIFSSLDPAISRELAHVMEWMSIKRDEVLIRQGEFNQQPYILYSGKLKFSVQREADTPPVQGDIYNGSLVGEMAMVFNTPREATVTATRDSEILTIPEDTLKKLLSERHDIYHQCVNLIFKRLKQRINEHEHQPSNREIISIIPGHQSIPFNQLYDNLKKAVSNFSNYSLFSYEDIIKNLGESNWERKFKNWLHDCEILSKQVVLFGSLENEKWNQTIASTSDRVYLLLDPSAQPNLTDFEKKCLSRRTYDKNGDINIVFFHWNKISHQKFISESIILRNAESWHHLRLGMQTDYERLARYIGGTTIGITFSGGGARGLAHIGAIKALRENGIVADHISGTSMGAMVGAAYANELSTKEMRELAWHYLNLKKPFKDYILPYFSLLRGKKVSQNLLAYNGNTIIEAMPIRFSAVATNLVTSHTEVIEDGPVWEAIRGSISLPGVLPPLLTSKGVLVDGAVLNNSPVDVLKNRHVGRNIIFDLESVKPRSLDEFRYIYGGANTGHAPSFFRYLYLKYFRKKSWPGFGEILLESLLLSSTTQSQLNADMADYKIVLPTSDYGMMDFASLDALIEIGYRETIERIDEIKQAIEFKSSLTESPLTSESKPC